MNIKKFFLISAAIHVIILVGVYFLPAPQIKKTREFLTQLVTPEQAKKPELPKIRPVPVPREAPKRAKPMQPRPPAPRVPAKVAPTPDRPVVPGMGKEDGRPLPEGASPKPGRGEVGRDGGGAERSMEPGYLEGEKPRDRGFSGRERLFDPGVIGDTAMKGEGSRKKNDALTFDTKDYRFAGYMRKLKEKIESIWEYPAEAKQKRLYGDLKIRFTIKKDGRLGAVELLRTSGYRALDDAALKALKEGEPYWPLPDEWGMESYTISGHFIYTMYGYGIR